MCVESEGYECQHVCEQNRNNENYIGGGISFIISPSTAALSHRKTVSAGTSEDSNKETLSNSSKEDGAGGTLWKLLPLPSTF